MIISVIGTGGVGGYYGAKLANAGQDVHFLFHKDYDFVKKNGLTVHSKDGDFFIRPRVYKCTQDMPVSDIVLVCLKTVNNYLLPELLPPLLKEDTLVILIQNGIGVEADVQKMFPGTWLAAGLAFICSAKTEAGIVNHQDYGSINIGNYSCPSEDRIADVITRFRAAGVDANPVEYNEARWKKAVWNMPFNGMTVVRNTSTDKLLSNPETFYEIREMMLEVITAAQHLGVRNLNRDFADTMITMTQAMTPYSPSMKLDWDFGRPMEIGYIYTRPVELSRTAGYEMKRLAELESSLRSLEASRFSR